MKRAALTCPGCGGRPRRVRGARWCSRCVAKQGKKVCTDCGERFFPDMMRGPRCRSCASVKAHAARIEKTYGVTAEQYAQLLEYQGGRCWICRRSPQSKRLAVDHDHVTGRVRGLLCKHDNYYIIGHLERHGVAEMVARIVDYLDHPPARELWGDDAPTAPEGQ